jgi:Tol biopolymer transport system component
MTNCIKINKSLTIVLLFIFIFFGLKPAVGYDMKTCIEVVREIAVIELGEISLWVKRKKSEKVFVKTSGLIYDSFNELIETPTFIHEGKELLYAKNVIAEDNGTLVVLHIEKKDKTILFKGRSIKSPIMSNDEKYVAFLSGRDTNRGYSLYLLEYSSGNVTKLIESDVYGEGYNLCISWFPTNNKIAFSDINGHIKAININSLRIEKITLGYNPIISQDGRMLIINQSGKKPYNPLIYYMKTGKKKAIKSKRIYNAIWAPSSDCLLVVKNTSSIFRWNEWERKLILLDINKLEEIEILRYEGFEYIAMGAMTKF